MKKVNGVFLVDRSTVKFDSYEIVNPQECFVGSAYVGNNSLSEYQIEKRAIYIGENQGFIDVQFADGLIN